MKTRLHKGEPRKIISRHELLAAAMTLGMRDGWASLTIRKLATKVGYTSPVLYEHFRNKEEVLLEIARSGFQRMGTSLSKSLAQPDFNLLNLAKAYWSFFEKNRQLYRLMNNMDGTLVAVDELQRQADAACKLITQAIRKWTQTEGKANLSSAEITDDLWALLHGMAAISMDRNIRFTPQRVSRAVKRYLDGVLTQI